MGSSTYNPHAGRSLERLATLRDGVFAVAITLFLLELHVRSPACCAASDQGCAADSM